MRFVKERVAGVAGDFKEFGVLQQQLVREDGMLEGQSPGAQPSRPAPVTLPWGKEGLPWSPTNTRRA